MYISRCDIPRKSTILMYNLDRIPNKTIHSIRQCSKNRNGKQIDCQRVLLEEEARFLKHRTKQVEIRL